MGEKHRLNTIALSKTKKTESLLRDNAGVLKAMAAVSIEKG